MDNACPRCHKPAPLNELHSFKMHEDCWIDMLIASSSIDDSTRGKPKVVMEKAIMKWMQIVSPN